MDTKEAMWPATESLPQSADPAVAEEAQRRWLPILLATVVLAVGTVAVAATFILVTASDDGAADVRPYADLIVRQAREHQAMIERSTTLRNEIAFLPSGVTAGETPYEDLILRQAKIRASAVDASPGYLEERAFLSSEVMPAETPYEDLLVRKAKNRPAVVDEFAGYLEEKAFSATTD